MKKQHFCQISAFFNQNQNESNGKNTTSERGRSMIEMLGVLTIIGLLSVTGLYGYKKAMEKLSLNRQAQQVNDFTVGWLTFIRKTATSNFSSREAIISSFIQLGYMPDSMVQTDSTTVLDYAGNRIWFDGIGSNYSRLWWNYSTPEQAVNIVQTLQRFSKSINYIRLKEKWYYGERSCKSGNYTCFSSLTLADLKEEVASQTSGGNVVIVFHRQ
jgi:hypothetical protein